MCVALSRAKQRLIVIHGRDTKAPYNALSFYPVLGALETLASTQVSIPHSPAQPSAVWSVPAWGEMDGRQSLGARAKISAEIVGEKF